MAYAHPTPTSRGLAIHGSLVDTTQLSNGPSIGLSISQPDITDISTPSPTVYQSSPLRARSPASIAGLPLLSPLTNTKSAPSGGFMKAADIKAVLEMKLAYLSGGRDREGRTIVTIPALPKGSERPKEDLATTLYYLVNTVSEEVRENGFCIVVDSRGYNWQTVKQTLRMLQECLPSQIHVVYIIQQGPFWQRRRGSFSKHSREKSRFEFSTITLSSMDKLLGHIEESQLTNDLGGFLPYNHKEWITFRLSLEQFMGEVDGLLENMAILEQHVIKEYLAEDVEGAEKVLQQHCSLEEEIRMSPQDVLKVGRDLISSIEQKPDCSGTSSITPDKINAAAAIRHLLDAIQRRQRHLEELWRSHKLQHEQNLQLKIFERSVYKVKNWLKGRGMEALSSKQDVGDSLAAIEVLWQQHEALEAKAQTIYDNLTQLRLMVDKLCGTKHFASADMRQCIAKLSNRYTFFDARLQERSDILRLSMTLHEHLEQWKEKCEQCRGEVMAEGLSLDDSTETQDKLMGELRESGQLLMQEGQGLLEMMQQQAELQMPHPPDYKKSARYVRGCLDEVEDKQKRVEQLSEARKVRLDQFKQVYTCEKDAKQALRDLENLLGQLSSCLGDLGNSLATTTRLRDEHTKITRAAKKTHEYGKDLLSAASKGRQACGLPQQPNQALLDLLSATWNSIVSRGNQHTNWLDMLMTFYTGQREVQQQLSWLQQRSSGKLPELDEAELSLTTIKETGPSTKQTAARTLDLGSDLLDELEQAKYFPTRDAACRSIQQQLEKLSTLTKEHATLLEDCEKRLKDCVGICQLQQQANEVIQWMKQSGQPLLLPSLGKDVRTCEEQLSRLETHDEAIEEYSRKADELLKSVFAVEDNQFTDQLQQINRGMEETWKIFSKRWKQREQRLLAAIQYYTTINHLQRQFELFEGHMRLADLPEEADEIELHLEKTQGDRKDLLNTFRQALEDGRAFTELLIHGEKEDVDIPAAERINEELQQLDKQRIKLDELWIKTQKYLNQTLEFQLKQQLHVSSLSPSEWLGSIAEPFISTMSIGTSSSEADEVIAKLDIYVKQAEDYQKQLGHNRGHVKDALRRVKEELQGRRGLLLQLRLLYSNVERCLRKLDALKDKKDTSLQEKAMHSINEVLKEGEILISQLEHFPLSSVRQVEIVCDRLKEKAGLSKRGSFSVGQTRHSSSNNNPMSKTDITKQLEAFEAASETFLIRHTELGDTAATAKALLKQYQQFQDTTEPMIAELEKAWEKRSKGEADLSDVYKRFSYATQSCRQVVTKRLTIITSLVEYYEQWQLLQDNVTELGEQLQEPFQHLCTQQDARSQLESGRPILQQVHRSHNQCKGYGKQFLEMALSEGEDSIKSHIHVSSLKMSVVAAKIRQQLDEADLRVQHLTQHWEKREHLLTLCIQGHALQMDCKKVSGELQKMLDSLEVVDLGTLETSEQLLKEHNQALQRLKEQELEVEELQEDADDMTEENHYNASALTEATLSLRSLYKQTQSKMKERLQLLESCGNFFARSLELMEDFDTAMREKVSRPAKLEGFLSRLSALCSEGTSLKAMGQGSISKGLRSDKVASQGIEDTITRLQHKMESYKKLDKRASAHFTSTTSSASVLRASNKRFSMSNYDISILPKLDLTANPLPAASRLFPEKKREGLRRAGSMRVERSTPVQKLSSKFEHSSLDDSYKPTPPERADSFKYMKTKRQASVNTLRQKFELLSTDQATPTSSTEDLSALASAGGGIALTKNTELSGKESPSKARRIIAPMERPRASTLPPKSSPPTKRFSTLKQGSVDRAESPKVSPQAIEAILQSLSLPDSVSNFGNKLDGGVAAGNRLSQHLHEQLPQLEESSDEELNKEMESLSTTDGIDEPDYGGKEKLKSLSAVTKELINTESHYLQSLECIADGYVPAWDKPYLAAFLVGKKEIIFSNLVDIFHFQKKFHEELATCKGVQEVCKCFKAHEEGFSLYLVFLKALPQGKKVLSQFGGDFFEMVRKEKRYSRSFAESYLHPSNRLNQYLSYLKEMMNAAQKEELHSVNIIRDTLKIFQRIDRIAAFTCITDNPEVLDEKQCLIMDDFMVYTVKKKKKKAEEMRVFLHEKCVIFTKAISSTEENSLSNHRVFEYSCSIQVNTLKLSETVEKGKHAEKFGLAENKAGPDREYILQPVSKSVEVKQEWCLEVNKLLLLQLEKLKQAKAHDSGSKLSESLPPPMMHTIELPSRYQKHKKTINRDSEAARGSVASRGSDRDSKRDSSQPGNVLSSKDIRHMGMEPTQSITRASTADRIIMYETTEPYDGSSKDGYLTLDKGCQVEVLDKSGSDWLVCTVAETCSGVEKEGIIPKHILTPVTRHTSRVISKQVSTVSSVSKRFSHISVRSNLSEHSTSISTTTGPSYLDEDLYVIVPPRGGGAGGTSKVSQPILSSMTSPPAKEQYIYYAMKDYHPTKDGHIRLSMGESVEVLDKSNPKEWVISTIGNEARPSEEGLVPADVLSAEYTPVRYDSLQGEYSGSDEGRSSRQQEEPPPIPPHHPNHDNDDVTQSTSGSHDDNKDETKVNVDSSPNESQPEARSPPKAEVSLQVEARAESSSDKETSSSPKPYTDPAMEDTQVEEDEAGEDTSSEQSDVMPPASSMHSSSTKGSPMPSSSTKSSLMPKKKDLPPTHCRNKCPLLAKSMTAVELKVPPFNILSRYGSDPSLQEPTPLSDSSPAYSALNLSSSEGMKSPMHERVSSILRESLISSARNRRHSSTEHQGGRVLSSLDRKRVQPSSVTSSLTSASPMMTELREILNRSKSSDASSGAQSKMVHDNRLSSITPEDALSEVKKLQMESVEQCSDNNKMEEFDKIEVYVAIADYTPEEEESNIPLRHNQHVQVLDSSRQDWWLVIPIAMTQEESSSEPLKEGWVPANHLEKLTSGSHDSASHDTAAEEQLKELYNCSFLVDDPSPTQLEGMFSIAHPYMAKEAIQGTMPGQLTLHIGQVVQVLDSKLDDWWLVATMATDKVPSIKGWVPAASLVAKSNDETPSQDQEQPPVWYVRATFQSEDEGMLSVQEGELVVVVDSSCDEWFYAKTVQRDPPCEGWVPASYIYQLESTEGFDIPTDFVEALDSPWLRSAHQNSQSESSSEFEADENQLFHEHLVSPDIMDEIDGEDHHQAAHEKRTYVISELIESEKDYVEKLRYCIENYVTAVISSGAPKTLHGMKDILFCNMEAIYDFHRSVFLPQLEQCGNNHLAVANCFVSHASQLEMYVNYCTYQAKSDSVFKEYCGFFADLCAQLKDRWQLADYLILPVQRITKYSLLLEHVLKYSIRAGEDCDEVDAALDVTRGVSMRANNAIHLSMLDIDEKKQKSYGTFMMQEKFDLVDRVEGGRTRLKDRRLFLFENVLVLSKKRRDDSADQETYFVKETLKFNELSATQDTDRAGLGLILYEMHFGNKYTFRAPSASIRDAWYSRVQELILANKVKKDTLRRTISEPVDPMSRSPSIPRKSVFGVRREPAKKSKHAQLEGSASYPNSTVATDDTEAQPGTQFLVLERIVMEGGDDLQLEPGEVVELVRKENNSTLYVRTLETTDAPAMEGNVPASFLRRKCVHNQSGLSEAMPKITKRPNNQTVVLGDTVTFSSIFNGFPTPSVTWRKGSVTLTTSEQWKITVSSNSTLFELSNVKFTDAGEYACAVSNSAGTDTAMVKLYVVGPPATPTRPIVSRVATTSLKLKWMPPEFNGNSEITTYQVEQLQEGLNEWLPIVQQPKTLFVVKTLEPNTSYQFRIIAYNEHGPSQPSKASQTISTKSTSKGGFLTAASPSFRKKMAPTISSNQIDSKGTDMTDYDSLSQQPATVGNTLGLPSMNQSLSQPPMDDSVFGSAMTSPPPSYIRTTPITVSYDLTLEELGRGRYGIVQKCISKKNQEAVAAKYLRLRTKKKLEICREAGLHQRLLHPHIIAFFDAFEAGRNLTIVMEIATGGELLDYIVQTKTLTEAIAVKYLSQVISALHYMHSLSVAHMDIRPENILLSSSKEPIVKLIDLGSARDLTLRVTPPSYGSPEFCAPEVLNKETVNEAADMWGLGALAFVILSGVSPFFGDNPQITRFHIKEGRYDFNATAFEQVSQDAKDFIRSLLQLHPQNRLSAKACQEHPWIKTLNPKGTGVPSWPMAKLDLSRLKTFIARRKWHSSNIAVETNHVFGGRMASLISRNSTEPNDLQDGIPPSLSGGPDNLIVKAADTVSFCHQVQGTPTPSIQWEHNNKQLLHSARVKITNDGVNVSMTILDAGRLDEGVYTCTALNSLGSMSAQTKLVVLDKPLPPSDLNSVSLGNNSALVSWSRPSHDGSSPITGYLLEHKRSDQDTWVLSAEEIHSTAHVVDDLLPGNNYQFRVAAVNAIGSSQFSKPSGTVSVDSTEEEEWDNMEPVKVKHVPFEKEYTFKEVISKGTFSEVRVCVENSTDRLYAAKVINLNSKQRSAQAFHEFDKLASLSHPRIVTIEGAFQSPEKFILVMEYLSGGELLSHLAEKETVTEEEYSHYIRQVLEGLHYIHSNNIIHMAVKPANIVLTSNHRDIKIVDFRMARYIQAGNQLEAIEGNPEFMAPETVSLKPVTTAADIWSVGIITCIMLTGVSPFLAKDQTTTIACIQAARLDNLSTALNEVSHDTKDFIINNVLKTNPRRRLTAAQLLRHRWLQANSRLKLTRSNSKQETRHLKQFVQHRKVPVSQE